MRCLSNCYSPHESQQGRLHEPTAMGRVLARLFSLGRFSACTSWVFGLFVTGCRTDRVHAGPDVRADLVVVFRRDAPVDSVGQFPTAVLMSSDGHGGLIHPPGLQRMNNGLEVQGYRMWHWIFILTRLRVSAQPCARRLSVPRLFIVCSRMLYPSSSCLEWSKRRISV